MKTGYQARISANEKNMPPSKPNTFSLILGSALEFSNKYRSRSDSDIDLVSPPGFCSCLP